MYFFAIAGMAESIAFPPQRNCFSGDFAAQQTGNAIIAVASATQAMQTFFFVLSFVILRTPLIITFCNAKLILCTALKG